MEGNITLCITNEEVGATTFHSQWLKIWRGIRQKLGSNKKCSRQGKFHLSNINFVRVFWLLKCFQSSVFWIFKLSRVNSVYEFPKLSPQLQIKSFKNSWRIDFFFFLIISCGKNRNIYEKKCSLRQSSREQKRKKRVHSMFTRGKL